MRGTTGGLEKVPHGMNMQKPAWGRGGQHRVSLMIINSAWLWHEARHNAHIGLVQAGDRFQALSLFSFMGSSKSFPTESA